MGIFTKNRYYIRLYINQIEIEDLVNNITISEKSELEFNNKRILIADFQKAENFINDVFLKNNLSLKNSIGIIQQIEMIDGGLSDVEKRILLEVFSRIGIRKVYIDESLTKLTQKEIAKYIK